MGEKQDTVDGVTYPLEHPFMVIATQNPIDYTGTYNLPEAQLDRFMMKISIGYPQGGEEKQMAERFLNNQLSQILEPVVDRQTIIKMQKEVEEVRVNQDIISYGLKVNAFLCVSFSFLPTVLIYLFDINKNNAVSYLILFSLFLLTGFILWLRKVNLWECILFRINRLMLGRKYI